jgi:hypothetical protein
MPLPPLAFIHEILDSKVSATIGSRSDTKSSPCKISTPHNSPYSVVLDDDSPLVEFTRRLSNAAQALADRGYKTPDSGDDSGTTEEMPRSDIGQVETAVGAQFIIASKLKEMIEQVLQKQEETFAKVAKEHVTIEAQRLATLITTQLPSAPPPVQPQQDMKFLYHLAEAAAMHGAEKANLLYQKHFCEGRLPTLEQARQLICDNVGKIVDHMHSWLILEPKNDPRYFCSTISRRPPDWNRNRKVVMTIDERHSCLVADETRYRSAFLTSELQANWGGLIEGRGTSRYPSFNAQREKFAMQQQLKELQQRVGNHRQPVYERPAVALGSVSDPPTSEQTPQQTNRSTD